jgi:hypothetical protein
VPGVLDQVNEEIEGLWRERNKVTLAEQEVLRGVQVVDAEVVDVGHGWALFGIDYTPPIVVTPDAEGD